MLVSWHSSSRKIQEQSSHIQDRAEGYYTDWYQNRTRIIMAKTEQDYQIAVRLARSEYQRIEERITGACLGALLILREMLSGTS